MNILFIGNSYTYYNDMPAIFQQIARDNGKDVTATAVTKGGRKLIEYRDPYNATTVKLAEALKQHYDICILQEQSILPITEFDTFIEKQNIEEIELYIKRIVNNPGTAKY